MSIPTGSRPSRPTEMANVVTPKNVDAEAIAVTGPDTPFANLRQLAGLMQRDSRQPQEPTMTSSLSVRLRAEQPRSGNTATSGRHARRPLSSLKRVTPTTSHTLRAIQRRRAAALTPGGSRRYSGRQQRETPRDTLRQLSKLLAPNTLPAQDTPRPDELSSAQKAPSSFLVRDDEESFEREPELPIPRLSLPLDVEEDDEGQQDDSFEQPPGNIEEHVEDENVTQRSVELARRALVDLSGPRYARASFGSIRFSDRFADVKELAEGRDTETNAGPGPDDNYQVEEDDGTSAEERSDDDMIHNDELTTPNLQRPFSDSSSAPRVDVEESGALLDDMDEPTFALSFPPPDPTATATAAAADDDNTPLFDSVIDHPDESFVDRFDETIHEPTTIITTAVPMAPMAASASAHRPRRRARPPRPNKVIKTSRHGIPYPSLPANMIRRIATTLALPGRRGGGGGFTATTSGRNTMSRETLEAIIEASDCFFEQVSDDLGAYAKHAGRKTIDESDMVTLMKRQRQINASATPFSLAQRYLPRELLQGIRMDYGLGKLSRVRKRKLESIREEDDDEEDEEEEEEEEEEAEEVELETEVEV